MPRKPIRRRATVRPPFSVDHPHWLTRTGETAGRLLGVMFAGLILTPAVMFALTFLPNGPLSTLLMLIGSTGGGVLCLGAFANLVLLPTRVAHAAEEHHPRAVLVNKQPATELIVQMPFSPHPGAVYLQQGMFWIVSGTRAEGGGPRRYVPEDILTARPRDDWSAHPELALAALRGPRSRFPYAVMLERAEPERALTVSFRTRASADAFLAALQGMGIAIGTALGGWGR